MITIWDEWNAWLGTPVGSTFFWTIMAVLALEFVGSMIQFVVRRYRATHLPVHPLRKAWEMWISDRIWIAFGEPTASERRWDRDCRKGAVLKAVLEQRQEHAWRRFYAEHPALVPQHPVEPVQVLSEPDAMPPHFGVPELCTYHED